MKYKQLPSEKLVQKVCATSFESPNKNRSVYNWGNEILSHIRFLENERVKLVQKYGKDDGKGNYSVTKDNLPEFSNKFKELLEMEIDKEIPDCPIQENWFDDDKCQYPVNKEMWLSGAEIDVLLKK